MVEGLGFRVQGLGFIQGLGFMVEGLGLGFIACQFFAQYASAELPRQALV